MTELGRDVEHRNVLKKFTKAMQLAILSIALWSARSKYFVAVGSIAEVIGSKCQVPMPVRQLPAKPSVK